MPTDRAVVVTTPRRPSELDRQEALAEARRLGLPYEARDAGIESIAARSGAELILVVSAIERSLWVPAGLAPWRFHGGMAVLRIRRMLKEAPLHAVSDPLLRACDLRPGDRFIDATAGACADALVAAWAVGPSGSVVAIESSPILHAVTSFGARRIRFGEEAIDAALDRLEVVQGSHLELLAAIPDRSADVIYFDPMFESPTLAPPGFEILRMVAEPAPLAPEAVAEATRVARRRVVLQERRGSGELERLGFRAVDVIGRSAPVRFGVIDVADRAAPP